VAWTRSVRSLAPTNGDSPPAPVPGRRRDHAKAYLLTGGLWCVAGFSPVIEENDSPSQPCR
jgi:hypothetical protein